MLYSDTSLFLFFDCDDKHISAQVTKLHGPVCNDSCVELFAKPDPENDPHYLNIELNCCGTLFFSYGTHRHDRVKMAPELAARIKISPSIQGLTKEESPQDNGWTMQAEIPFSVLHEFAGIKKPVSGSIWKINLYRVGGKTDMQHATWADVRVPKPDFHQPEYFQEVMFE
jgi:hypothetical protein